MNRNITSAPKTRGPNQTDIKPSDVYDTKLQTQKLIHRTRQLRTQLSRLQDQITSHTNAINRTFDQQSETPQISSNHNNTIPQLQRSIESAKNTLQTLKNELQRTRNDDKTFSVRELQEEVKIAYCEHQRLTLLLQDHKIEAHQIEKSRIEAENRCSNPKIAEVKTLIKEVSEVNSSLSDKSNAYNLKKSKLRIEAELKNVQITPKYLTDLEEKKNQLINENNKFKEQLVIENSQHGKDISDLRQIIDDLRNKIVNKLSGKPIEKKEETIPPKEESSKPKEENVEKQNEK